MTFAVTDNSDVFVFFEKSCMLMMHRSLWERKLTVTVHPVERRVEAEVSRVVLTPVLIQLTGETQRGRAAASSRKPEQHTQVPSQRIAYFVYWVLFIHHTSTYL